MVTNKQIADAIFKDVTLSLDDLEKRYPMRNLDPNAEVTRFAPSPTGFLHTGSLFTSLICYRFAKQSNGVFYVRLEDTDQKREIVGSGATLINQLKEFGLTPDEGYFGDYEQGEYGPYVQSKRADIYKVAIKYLLEQGKAYPCFCSQEDIDSLRKKQEENKIMPGYYGQFAKCRYLTNEERLERINRGDPFVIRFKSSGSHLKKIRVSDLVHGDFDIAQNDLDIVIYKSDGLPTYHFAHVVDDHFMRTTTVIRGGEWIASLPIHLELFEAMGWKAPKYAHLPVIMKLDDNGNKRKLSKRLDKEAAVSYFLESGYPADALIMYLMTIVNSNFEEWIFEHKFDHMEQFNISFSKMSLEGALFDMGKVVFFSKEILAKKTKYEMLSLAKDYASKYDEELLKLINLDENYFMEIMNIEREKENPRKDYSRFGELKDLIDFFYKEKYIELVKDVSLLPFNPKFTHQDIIDVLTLLKQHLSLDNDESTWFASLKEDALSLNYAANNKMFKANPEAYKGTVSDVAEMLRITVTSRKNSPNLFCVMKVLGKEETINRINQIISLLS
ncbi:MAG: glutamate--tRNA ligase [Bacilli bacterium]